MNDLQILERLSEADEYAPNTPMPIAAWSQDVALAEIDRRIGRAAGPATKTTVTQWWRTGGVVAAAAFAAVLLLGVAVMLLTGNSDDVSPAVTETTQAPPTTQAAPPTTDVPPTTSVPPTTVPVVAADLDPEALAFAEALLVDLNAGDAEAAMARFPDGMTFRSNFFSREGLAGWFEHSVAMESTFELGECVTPVGGVTRCEWYRSSEFEPYYPLREKVIYNIRLDDGQPAFAQINHEKAEWWEVELEFMSWLAATHPAVGDTLYNRPGDVSGGPKFFQPIVAADLKKEYVALWKSSLGESTFADDSTGLPASYQAVLDRFVTSYNEGELATHLDLFAPGVITVLGDTGGRPSPNGNRSGNDFNRSLERHREKVAWEMAMGAELVLSECEEGEVVHCLADYTDFYLAPTLGSAQTRLELGISGGEIVSYRETAIGGVLVDGLDDRFGRYLTEELGSNSGLFAVSPFDIRFSASSAIRWHVFGRLFLESLGHTVTSPPFAEGVALDDLATAVKFADAYQSGDIDGWMDMWDEPTYVFSDTQEYTWGPETVRSLAEFAVSLDGSMMLDSCEPLSEGRISCVYLLEDAFTRAVGLESVATPWSFSVVDGRVANVRRTAGNYASYISQVPPFLAWAEEHHPDTPVEVENSLEFVMTEENAAAILSLLDEYSAFING